MCGAVNVVPLLALLVCARAHTDISRDCYWYERGRNVAIDITTGTNKLINFDNDGKYYIAEYGFDIELLCCSHDAANLTVQGGESYEAEKFVKSTSRVLKTVINANLGMHEFRCENTDTDDTVTLRVKVDPSMTVISPRVHHKELSGLSGLTYFVPLGDAFSVFCFGKGDGSLTIYNDRPHPPVSLQTDIVNATTIVHATKAENIERMLLYTCRSEQYSAETIGVIVNYYPEAVNIQCILHQRNRYELECWWRYPAADVGSSRLLQDWGSDKKVLCFNNQALKARSCVASIYGFTNSGLDLILETCNSVFCANQTFFFDGELNTKLGPPSDLRVLKTSSRDVTVAWRTTVKSYVEVEYKVEYKMNGKINWQQVYTSPKICFYGQDCSFQLQLQLPCPDSHYEMKVYAKTDKSVGNKFWSEPSDSLFFYTSPQNPEDVTNLECKLDFNEPPPITDEAVLHEVRNLIHYERKEESTLKKQIKGLKEKLREAEALMDYLAESDAKGDA